jgi:hypothetical protein
MVIRPGSDPLLGTGLRGVVSGVSHVNDEELTPLTPVVSLILSCVRQAPVDVVVTQKRPPLEGVNHPSPELVTMKSNRLVEAGLSLHQVLDASWSYRGYRGWVSPDAAPGASVVGGRRGSKIRHGVVKRIVEERRRSPYCVLEGISCKLILLETHVCRVRLRIARAEVNLRSILGAYSGVKRSQRPVWGKVVRCPRNLSRH